jgi:hypothetical protein
MKMCGKHHHITNAHDEKRNFKNSHALFILRNKMIKGSGGKITLVAFVWGKEIASRRK